MLIRVLVVDDHAFVRDALVGLFADTADIRVVGTCVDGSEVAEAAAQFQPDVVLMDLEMPRMTGLEAARKLLAAQPHMRVVVLSGSSPPASVREAKALGAYGFLLKGDNPSGLPDQIRAVAAGRKLWPDAAA